MGVRTRLGAASALAVAALTGALMTAGCAGSPMPVIVSHRCSDTRFPIYFQPGSDQLTPEADAVIKAYARRVSACRVSGVEVLGLADVGASTDPLELSQKRASAVARAMVATGFPAPSFDLVAQGAAGGATPSGRRTPIHRRTEVLLHVSPPTAGA